MFFNFLVSFKKKFENPQYSTQGGFGLIELMVSVTIMVIVSGIVITNQNAFNSAVLLSGQAYEIAFQIREVQQSAVSATYDEGTYKSIRGLYFDQTAGNNQHYVVFKDDDADGWFDNGEQFGAQGFIDPRFEIDEIKDENSDTVGPQASIIFVRPNFDARFFKGSGTADEIDTDSLFIDIKRVDSVDDIRTIEVTATGQISVSRPTPP